MLYNKRLFFAQNLNSQGISMKILVLNCGSSSVKYQMWDTKGAGVLAKGLVSRIGIDKPKLEHQVIAGNKKLEISPEEKIDHTRAIELTLSALTDKEYGVLSSISEIEAVGHRVVHGGEEFSVILPATKGEQGIITAERVRIALKNEIFKPRPDTDIRVTVSIGLAQHARNEEMMDFLRRADQNLYKAKASGKNQVCFSQ